MKVLVTGHDGQLARCLVDRAQGIELVRLGRPELDLEVPGSAARAIAAHAPDVVVNAAAYTAVDAAEVEPERAMRVNGEAAGEVAAAARAVMAEIAALGGTGGVITVGRAGAGGWSFTTPGMYRGRVSADAAPVTALYGDETR